MNTKIQGELEYKPINCAQCGDIVCYKFAPKDEEIEGTYIHPQKRNSCIKKHRDALLPLIPVEEK